MRIDIVKKDGTAFKSGETWYNLPKGKTLDSSDKGREISINGKPGKPGSFNVSSFEFVEAPESRVETDTPVIYRYDQRDARIVAQNALGHATNLVVNGVIKPEQLLDKAKVIADWAMGYIPFSTEEKAEEVKPQPKKVKQLKTLKEIETPYSKEEDSSTDYDDEVPF